MKGLPFVNRRSDRRGVHHSVENGIYKGKGLDLTVIYYVLFIYTFAT